MRVTQRAARAGFTFPPVDGRALSPSGSESAPGARGSSHAPPALPRARAREPPAGFARSRRGARVKPPTLRTPAGRNPPHGAPASARKCFPLLRTPHQRGELTLPRLDRPPRPTLLSGPSFHPFSSFSWRLRREPKASAPRAQRAARSATSASGSAGRRAQRVGPSAARRRRGRIAAARGARASERAPTGAPKRTSPRGTPRAPAGGPGGRIPPVGVEGGRGGSGGFPQKRPRSVENSARARSPCARPNPHHHDPR